jgi:hypothetical protein
MIHVPAESIIASIYCVAGVAGSSGTVTLQSPDAYTLIDRGEKISITLTGLINNGLGKRRGRGQPIYDNPYRQ